MADAAGPHEGAHHGVVRVQGSVSADIGLALQGSPQGRKDALQLLQGSCRIRAELLQRCPEPLLPAFPEVALVLLMQVSMDVDREQPDQGP